MGFNLSKGERFDLSKAAPGLTKVRIGLGWDPNDQPGGPDFDLDVSAFAIDEKFKIPSDSYFVFYGQVNSGNGVEDETEKGLFRPITEDVEFVGAFVFSVGLILLSAPEFEVSDCTVGED